MKTSRIILVSLAAGFVLGWFTLRSPDTFAWRELRADLSRKGESVKDRVRMLVDFEKNVADMEQMPTMSQSVALGALRLLETKEIGDVEKVLAFPPSNYHLVYEWLDIPKKSVDETTRMATLQAIESAAQRHPALKQKIEERIEGLRGVP